MKTVITHQVGSSFEAEHEAWRDGDEDAPPKGTEWPPSNLGGRRRTEEDSESDAPYTPELDIVFDSLGRVGRKRAMLGACAPDPGADLLAAVATGGTP